MKNLITCLVVCVLSGGAAFATTWTVDDDGKADFDNIQAAVDAASDGDEILVMPGTYTSTADEVVDMRGKEIWLHSSKGAEVTIIDGESTRRGIFCFNNETNQTIIEGFNIQNCTAVWDDWNENGKIDSGFWEFVGGGMANYESSPKIINCFFKNNTTEEVYGGSFGAGMSNYKSSPMLINCLFESNIANGQGGGIANKSFEGIESNPDLTNCIFKNNSSDCGGGMISYGGGASLTSCIFENNTAVKGGAIYNRGSHFVIGNSSFLGNHASGTDPEGGAIWSRDNNSILSSCIFEGNSATGVYSKGGAIWNYIDSNISLIDCVFQENEAELGGAIANEGSDTVLNFCTIKNNLALGSGGGIWSLADSTTSLSATIVCGNVPEQILGGYLDNGNNYVNIECSDLDSDGDGVLDVIDNCILYNPDQEDCNNNDIGDVCDIAGNTSPDCDQNGVPDECQPDCDGDGWIDPCDNEGDCDNDGIPDNCELDCNENNVPDDCDIIYGISQDCNENGVPDECDIANGTEADCNGNNIPDSCDLEDPANDQNNNGVLDECECVGDADLDGYVNVNDLLIVVGYWNTNAPQADLNFDGIVNVSDLLIVVGNWGECE